MYDEIVKELRHIDEFAAEINRPTSGIFREAADAIEELQNKLSLSDETGKALCHTAHKLLDEVPRWIPVTERLPENYKLVLLYNGEDIATGYMHSDKRFTVNGSHFPSRPTHWMPLPEPPKAEEGE